MRALIFDKLPVFDRLILSLYSVSIERLKKIKIKDIIVSQTFESDLALFFFEIDKAQHSQRNLALLKKEPLLLFNDVDGEKAEIFIDKFTGAYNHEELNDYLEIFAETLDNSLIKNPVGFMLSSTNHEITIGYNSDKKLWYCINANDLPTKYIPKEELNLVSKLILEGFSDNKIAIFSTQIYGAISDIDTLKNAKNTWRENKRFKKIHTVTSEKALWTSSNTNAWLYISAMEGELDTMKKLLNSGALINQTINDDTPFLVACYSGQFEAAKYLFEKGADIHKTSTDGSTALKLAAGSGNLDLFNFLLALNFNTNDKDMDGHTSLMDASEFGHLAIIEVLLEQKVNINKTNKKGLGALHIASIKGYFNVVKKLLEHKAEINHIDINNEQAKSPLHFATMCGHQNIVALLLESGAIIDAADSYGCTALIYAAANGQIEIVKSLLERGASLNKANHKNITALLAAVTANEIAVVQLLLEKGANPNQISLNDNNVLMLAIGTGNLSMVKLFTNERNLKHKTQKGVTAYLCAANYSNNKIFTHLAKDEANINQVANNGCSALHYAAQNGNIRLAKYLLAHSININAQALASKNVLLSTSNKKGNNALKALFKAHDINEEISGFTALHLAVWKGYEGMVALFLNSGATLNDEASLISVFDLAFTMGHKALYKSLYEHLNPEQRILENTKMVLRKLIISFEAPLSRTNGFLDIHQHLSKTAAIFLYKIAKAAFRNPNLLEKEFVNEAIHKLFQKPRTKNHPFFVNHLQITEKEILGLDDKNYSNNIPKYFQ